MKISSYNYIHANRSYGGYSPFQQILISLKLNYFLHFGRVAWILVSTLVVLALIRVFCFTVDPSYIFNVLQSFIRPTTVTSIVSIITRTVDEILLTEWHQLVSFAKPLSFKGSSLEKKPVKSIGFPKKYLTYCTETPTGTTIKSLIFYFGYRSSLGPI